ncbi:M56 family metallopeptidase [Dyella sp.]|uniref:M56 family metallopeptidase n=1 Tax=Dyella sp. TaxID=1869338 RepID=UPI002B4A27E6|nr:M56 family metallopeptidase [Dyella sp.]HKT28957.1 M56 family metallopeptidase [Dyella sp.]
MIEWMIYVVLVTLTLSAAALAAERAAKVRRAATRWVWIASLIGSLLLPTVIATASIRLPKALASSTTSTSAPIALRNTTSIPMPPMLLDLGDAQVHEASVRMDTLISDTWMAISLLMALALVVSSMLLHRRKRGWRERMLCSEQVLVASDAGPAVIGLLRSRIVVPAWLLQASEAQQQCTIAHERSHLRAHDPQLVAFALILLILMPWNTLLWWQFHRLRRAIEVDCDARVLQGGHDVGTYCETLIQVGQRRSRRIGVVPAMSGSASFLELRIRHMLRKQKKWAHASAAVLICISLGMATFAAQVTPPDATYRNTHGIAELSSDTLDRYIGFYQNDSLSLITVTRDGNGLTVSVSGAMGVPKPFHIVPINETRFAVEGDNPLGVVPFPGDKGAEPTVEFTTDNHGRALRLVANQNGHVIFDQPRIDKAAADRINDALATRIKMQKPFPGSEKALQLFLSDPNSRAGMGDSLAWVRAHNKAAREKFLTELGPVESYTFRGVTKFGADDYLVKRKHGMETVLLMLDGHGNLVSAFQFDSRSRFAKMDLIPAA